MLPKGSIQTEQLWKRFRPDRRGFLLRAELTRLAVKLRGGDASRMWRWPLRDVNLSIAPGEAVGLIGPNGSGKTTLLKILSRVMHPYAGRVEVAGRVGALIEIRAGIHPDLSGRENIFMFGTLLGLSRREVARRFDEIIAFAELEDAVDRQVKFYSSGMQMRLGFAVAAFLEPDVLLVDEVLAVGDASFQQRCLERMREVLRQGTTLIYVSHDLASVEATCSRGVWLSRGVIEMDGPIRAVLDGYRSSVEEVAEFSSPESAYVRVVSAEVTGEAEQQPRTQGRTAVRVVLQNLAPGAEPMSHLIVGVSAGTATPIFVLRHDLRLGDEEREIRCFIERLPLPRGRFYLWLGVFGRGKELLAWHPAARFEVIGKDLDETPRAIARLAPVHVEASWESAPSSGDGHVEAILDAGARRA